MAMQNITAALENKMLKELFSNCNYKCFLDQGGADANALAQIQELSQTEFNALNSEEVGKGVMVWGKKVVLFDAKISKENELYPLINTNFHEKAKEAEKVTAKTEAKGGIHGKLEKAKAEIKAKGADTIPKDKAKDLATVL